MRRWCVGVVGLVILSGCDDPGSKTAAVATASASATAAPSVKAPNPSATARAVPFNTTALQIDRTLKDAEGKPLATLRIDGEKASVLLGDRAITATPRGGSRRYEEAGRYLGTVKRRGAQVKLRGADGRIRFTATVFDDRVEILADGTPFMITKQDGGAEVSGPKGKLGQVRFGDPVRVLDAAGKVRFQGQGEAPSMSWGVALLDAIPAPERQILLLEIATRGG